jgi:hypothetical protein
LDEGELRTDQKRRSDFVYTVLVSDPWQADGGGG